MSRLIALLLLLCSLLVGCALTPPGGVLARAFLTDISSEMAKVGVSYDILGPTVAQARTAANIQAGQHCRAYDKSAQFASSSVQRANDYAGNYYFLYRCMENGN